MSSRLLLPRGASTCLIEIARGGEVAYNLAARWGTRARTEENRAHGKGLHGEDAGATCDRTSGQRRVARRGRREWHAVGDAALCRRACGECASRCPASAGTGARQRWRGGRILRGARQELPGGTAGLA